MELFYFTLIFPVGSFVFYSQSAVRQILSSSNTRKPLTGLDGQSAVRRPFSSEVFFTNDDDQHSSSRRVKTHGLLLPANVTCVLSRRPAAAFTRWGLFCSPARCVGFSPFCAYSKQHQHNQSKIHTQHSPDSDSGHFFAPPFCFRRTIGSALDSTDDKTTRT